jgi:hypothetical protein
MNDTNLFIQFQFPQNHVIMFACDTYLYTKEEDICGKIMYTSIAVHGTDSICEKHSSELLYKTAYRHSANNEIYALSDTELQNIGMSLGFEKGKELNNHLCYFSKNVVRKLIPAMSFLDHYYSEDAMILADEVATKYRVEPKDLLITGGLQLFPRPIHEAHDIDIVIPIDRSEQLDNGIFKSATGINETVVEYGFRWPLRWRSSRGHLVCPFFVYRSMEPCIAKAFPLKNMVRNIVTVTDDSYGIFNTPVILVKGECGAVFCRSTLLRGMIKNGYKMDICCPVYHVTDGKLKGNNIAVITNPLKEILNIREILNGYRN